MTTGRAKHWHSVNPDTDMYIKLHTVCLVVWLNKNSVAKVPMTIAQLPLSAAVSLASPMLAEALAQIALHF